ncbi:hypothetical protein C8J55DRAFT_502223 [Lentinula edodes]|uniref:Uncharacterized protein n=1 Tax=Lentinula lateritia TaxID=40482 RepID=A0A9W9AY39_9AGAR|nr:hypothetical protein C8J55DRAFT_502223 [Lentinula edodes]
MLVTGRFAGQNYRSSIQYSIRPYRQRSSNSMLPKLLPKLLLAFFLLSTFAGTIASPLAARAFNGRYLSPLQDILSNRIVLLLGWIVIMLRRISAQKISLGSQTVPEPGETWSVFVTGSAYFQAEPRPGEYRPWQGTGIKSSRTRCSWRTGLVIARVQFASSTEKKEVLEDLGKLKATSNLLYLIKVLREMAAMAQRKEKITGFEWKNQLEWQQQYWKMIEMFEDGLGGKVDGNEKKIYQDLLMKRQEKAKEMEAKKSGES